MNLSHTSIHLLASVFLLASVLVVTSISACTINEDQISLRAIPTENAMDIGKIDKNTHRLTVYRQSDKKPVSMKDCADTNVCFVIPQNASMRVVKSVKINGVSQCDAPYEAYIASVVLLDPDTLLDKLDGMVSAELQKAVIAYPKLMDVNFEYLPLKAIANSDFFLQPDIGLYSEQIHQVESDFTTFANSIDAATIEQVIANDLTTNNSEKSIQLMNKVFPTTYSPKLTPQQLFSGLDGVKIMILGKDKESNELTLIEHDDRLKSAFACIDAKMSKP